MSDQINLKKKLRSRATPWLEWHGWTTGKSFGWLEQLHRSARFVKVGDIKSGERTYPTPEAALTAKMRAVEKKLKDGFEYRDEPPPPPPAKPSKPWAKGKVKPPRWLAKADKAQLARARKLIDDAKLTHRSADIQTMLRPAIHFKLSRVKDVKGVVTRFGGDPDLPAKFAWPKNGTTPLAFVAQYRMEELAKYDLEGLLPRRGVFSIFAQLADGDDYGSLAKAFHFPDAKKLVRTVPAHTRDADDRPKHMAIATPSPMLTLPAPDERAAGALRLLGDERDAYHDEVWLALDRNEKLQPAHQLLGWPNGTTEYGKPWTLLAQIDSDDRFGFEIGDVETLRIFTSSAMDLRKLRTTMNEE